MFIVPSTSYDPFNRAPRKSEKYPDMAKMKNISQQVVDFYSNYLTADLDRLDELYASNISFKDPLHELYGIDKLKQYFVASKRGLMTCRFDFSDVKETDSTIWMEWVMRYSHRKLKGGKPLTLHGSTVLKLDEAQNRIVRHCDYYDLGEMLYEQLPVLGSLVRTLRRKVAESL